MNTRNLNTLASWLENQADKYLDGAWLLIASMTLVCFLCTIARE